MKGDLTMLKKIKKMFPLMNFKFLSSLATLAITITTIASNQRCWYIMHEEELPEGFDELRKF